MLKNYDLRIAQQLQIRPEQVKATISLLDEGNTIPFIARYRKEMTLNLDEFLIRQIEETVGRLRTLDDRRETILSSIEQQGKLSSALRQKIEEAETITTLEDLYQPYKQKRSTRASVARERGLEALAALIIAQGRGNQTPQQAAQNFLNDEVLNIDDALSGARDIVAESISDDADVRSTLREKALVWGSLHSERIKNSSDDKATYELYYSFDMRVDRLKPHQVLAINRGESEKVLRVSVDIPERDWQDAIMAVYRPDRRSAFAEQLELAIADAAKRLLLPAIERDVRRSLSEKAEEHAIEVFAQNLRGLLTQPPLNQHTVMGVDPAYRTGCKIAVVDPSGKMLVTNTIYPHAPQNQSRQALATLAQLIQTHRVTLIAIGNGTASRETEQLVAELTRAMPDVRYLMVNEAGASVYSASDIARQELPDMDVSLRGAVSIARRALDPLAELVKIDPKSIGVGLYQHDINQKALSAALDGVVESVVNEVGVDANTASPALLRYVAGIGPKLAGNIVQHRDQSGPFISRAAIKKVSGMGAKAFEQSAGFLRVRDGRNPLDASAIHPESYAIAEAVLQRARITMQTSIEARESALTELKRQTPVERLATELATGPLTLADILEQIARPGRDPREALDAPLLRSDVLSMSDLKTGMQLSGTVRNVVDFGAFVDIGVKQDGLLHVSKIPRNKQLSVGDVIKVSILTIDAERGRIGLDWRA